MAVAGRPADERKLSLVVRKRRVCCAAALDSCVWR